MVFFSGGCFRKFAKQIGRSRLTLTPFSLVYKSLLDEFLREKTRHQTTLI